MIIEQIENIGDLLRAISNSRRLQLLFSLYEMDLSWTLMVDTFKISHGALYFHLCKLENYQLIKRNEDKTYTITEKGKSIIRYIIKLQEEMT